MVSSLSVNGPQTALPVVVEVVEVVPVPVRVAQPDPGVRRVSVGQPGGGLVATASGDGAGGTKQLLKDIKNTNKSC